MATTSSPSRSRFSLGATVWIVIAAVLLVVLAAAAVLYVR
jgi:hypothetical protein